MLCGSWLLLLWHGSTHVHTDVAFIVRKSRDLKLRWGPSATVVRERRQLWSFCGSKTCWKCPGQHSESGQPALAFYGSGFAIACYGLRVCHRLPPFRVEGFPPTGFAVHFLLFEHIFQVCYCASLHRVPNIAFWGLPPTGFPLFRLMV